MISRIASWIIYGATGYTGQRIAREAVRLGMRPILAARSAERLRPLIEELSCEGRVFDLSSVDTIAQNIRGCHLVVNCAGPFSRTALSMVSACLRARCHYLDVTGEIDVIENIAARHEEALSHDISLIPAVGFDVVPTDALAVLLKQALPDAVTLQLAFTSTGSLSAGTARTMWEVIQRGGQMRKNGTLRTVPLAHKTLRIPFRSGKRWAALVPWGDVASAWYSTRIPNIEVYLAMPRSAIAVLKLARSMIPALASTTNPVNAQKLIRAILRLPSANHQDTVSNLRSSHHNGFSRQTELWGSVTTRRGERRSASMTAPDGYDFTVESALAAVQRVLSEPIAPGFATPTQAFGTDFALSRPGVDFRWEEGEPLPQVSCAVGGTFT